ncbi:hypothetical protein GYMLUDRAFT_925854 [Collybiopsis luxurians FD-317 M1]|uniref:Uncharacterized protein n=1 Tax=Collybiopsis luxurians FD-317 M1 TaxID=944289 RepID=A0A0D0BGG1_9AGAR|nr:hypothetical protein GYMLUDRAFT_925854 [Collybiopsis luxurians FD-317 M1]
MSLGLARELARLRPRYDIVSGNKYLCAKFCLLRLLLILYLRTQSSREHKHQRNALSSPSSLSSFSSAFFIVGLRTITMVITL